MKKILSYLFFASFLVSNLVHGEIISEEKIISAMKSAVTTKESLSKVADAYPMFYGTKKQILIKHFKKTYQDGSYVSYIAEQFIQAGLNDTSSPIYKNNNNDIGMVAKNFSASIAESLLVKGLSRLSYENQKYFISHMTFLMNIAEPRQCAAYLYPERFEKNDAMKDALIEMELLAKLPDTYIERYFFFARKAMSAEIKDSPIRREPSKSQQEFAQNAFDVKIGELYENHPNLNAILNFSDNPNSIDYKAGCDSGLVVIDAMLSLEGNIQDWYLQNYMLQLH